jgi:YD repeat-containing protein
MLKRFPAFAGATLAATAAWAQPYAFSTIDPTQAFFTIIPYGINDSEAVSGLWVDTAQVSHGFIAQGATFTTFDAPLADATKVGALRGTAAGGIDNSGTTVGTYSAGGTQHGFIREADGSTASLDIAGHLDTQLFDINNNGQTIGAYADSHALLSGTSFLRSSTGVLTIVAMPGSSFSQAQGLNDAGAIVGGWYDAASVLHGYVRAPNGLYTTIDVPGADATIPSGINDAGWIVGEYDRGGVAYAYVRDPLGAITTIDVPGATFAAATGIDSRGDIVGQYCDASDVCHGFLAVPVPEPATWTLLLAGIGAVGVRLRRGPARGRGIMPSPNSRTGREPSIAVQPAGSRQIG